MLREGALKIVLVVVGLLFLALVYPMTVVFLEGSGAVDDAEPVRYAGNFLAIGSAEPVGES